MAGATFLFIIGISLIVSLIFGMTNVDFDSAWTTVGYQAVVYSLYFVLFVMLCRKLKFSAKDTFHAFNLNKPANVHDIVLTTILAFVSIASFLMLSSGFIHLFELMGFEPGGELYIDSVWLFLALVLTSAILPAIVEELLFRGVIFHSLMRHGKVIAVLVSSLLFSLFHLSPLQTVYQFIFGVLCALLYLRSGRMIYPILLHFINNLAVITYTYITGQAYMDPSAYTSIFAIVATTAVLAIAGGAVLWQGLKLTARKQERAFALIDARGKRFWCTENALLFVGVGFAMLIWIVAFIG